MPFIEVVLMSNAVDILSKDSEGGFWFFKEGVADGTLMMSVVGDGMRVCIVVWCLC